MTTQAAIEPRLNIYRPAHEALRAMRALEDATKELDLDPTIRELARIRVSQINGCAYCIDMHTKDARKAGESEQRIYALSAWRETPFFTNKERAALALAESITLVAETHVPEEAVEQAQAELNETEGRGAGLDRRRHQRLEQAGRNVPRPCRQLRTELTGVSSCILMHMDELLTVREVARRCRVHEMTVRRHIRQGRLRSVRIGRGVRVREADLQDYVEGGNRATQEQWKVFTSDDPLFKLIGIGESSGPTDVSANKHKYIAEAVMASWESR